MVEPPVAVIVTLYAPAASDPGLEPLGSTPPLPQPLRLTMLIAENTRNSVKIVQRVLRRGIKMRTSTASPTWIPADSLREKITAEVWTF